MNKTMDKTSAKDGKLYARHTQSLGLGLHQSAPHRERLARRRCIVAIGTLLALLLSVLAQAIGTSGAFAHAGITSISPANGSVNVSAPKTISITFNEGVEASAGRVQVIDSKAKIVATRLIISSDKGTLSLTPSKPLPKGMYALRWSVDSADGHVVTGASTFAVGRVNKPGKPVNINAVDRNGKILALRTTRGLGSKTFTISNVGSKVDGLELRHKQLGATLELRVVGGKAQGIIPFGGEWTLTVVERVSTYAQERYVAKVTFK